MINKKNMIRGGGILLIVSIILALFAGIMISSSALHPKSDGTVFATGTSATLKSAASTQWNFSREYGGTLFDSGTQIKKLTITNKSSFIQGKTPIKGSPVDVSAEDNESLLAYIFAIPGETDYQEMVIYGNVDTIYAPQDSTGLFSGVVDDGLLVNGVFGSGDQGFLYLEEIIFDCFDTSNMQTMDYMFASECGAIYLENLNLTTFNVSNVSSSEGMFTCCDSLSTIYVPYEQLDAFKALDNESKASAMIGCVGDYVINRVDSNGSDDSNGAYVSITAYIGSSSNVTIPDSITIGQTSYDVIKIGYGAFEGNSTINTVVIGNNVQVVQDNAFRESTVKNVTFGSSVSYIEEYVFYDCSGVSVKFLSSTPPDSAADHGEWSSAVTSIEVPNASEEDYLSHEDWSAYSAIIFSNGGSENTGVVIDVVIPTVVCACLVVAIVFVARKKKMNA